MSKKAKFSWFFISLASFCVLVLFNNCGKMESTSGANNPSRILSEGEMYYETYIKFQLTACAACHSWSYQRVYNLSMSGTAMNNTFINRTAGTSHPGGSFCTTKDTGLCSNLVEWWDIEFGAM